MEKIIRGMVFILNHSTLIPADTAYGFRKIQLRIQNKEQILKELDKLGINSATLFPAIDNVASYLKNL